VKLKSRPEDFIVSEVSNFTPDPAGKFYVYEMEKRSLATLEALSIIARRAGMRPAELSASGLKDKHALTRQLFSSPRALPGNFADDRIRLKLVGKTTEKLTAGSIVGNRFEITMRRLWPNELAVIPRNAEEIRVCGVPNYYDDQRFGGIAHGQGFIAKALARGDFEEALRLHLAVPYRKQSMTDKANRRLAAELWGDWDQLYRRMKRSPERALVEYLVQHPADYAGCFERITPSLRILFVSAYQSFLFNQTLQRMIQAAVPDAIIEHNRGGELAFHRAPLEWTDVEAPLPGPGTRLEKFPHAAPHLEEVLRAESLNLKQLALEGLDRTGFKASARKALIWPIDLQMGPAEPDELNEGYSKLGLRFQLGRGSFATIITRRLVLGSRPARTEPDDQN
jgi:tRNA pseudouridine13 synthase